MQKLQCWYYPSIP